MLIFSHGNGMNSAFYTALLEEIASYGYIVVGIDHTYNALLTTLPDGQVISATPEAVDQSEDDFIIRLADVSFVIDQLAEVNTHDDLLKGSLDLAHLGLIGHSFGGATMAEACRMDSRCQAVIVIDVPLQGEVAEIGLTQPIMLLDAELLSGEQYIKEVEALMGQPAPEGMAAVWDSYNVFRDNTAALLLGASSDAYRVVINGTRHNSFTDLALLVEIQPALRLNVGMATIETERGLRVMNDYIQAFFDTYLKGEVSPLLEGAAADYPEVIFERGEN